MTVIGQAVLVRDPDQIARYHQALPPWPISTGTGQIIRLYPAIISGYHFLSP